uniref:Uncharacterized protein n=1 Tax=viral metagenome TaxID=1070528 RepID=A0A6M3L959_9ZZZZ
MSIDWKVTQMDHDNSARWVLEFDKESRVIALKSFNVDKMWGRKEQVGLIRAVIEELEGIKEGVTLKGHKVERRLQ